MKYFAKIKPLGATLFLFYLVYGTQTGIWTPNKFLEAIEKQKLKSRRIELKSKLEKLADADGKNGLSNNEKYIMELAMGVQDSSINYSPTIEQLQRGIQYFKQKSLL